VAASMRRVSVVWFVALALALSLIGTLAVPVRAATITVSTTADVVNNESEDCSLREAIAAANTNTAVDACPAGEAAPVVDTINVPAGTYTLANGELDVAESVAIVGEAAASTIIDAADESRVFNLSGGAVAISNVTITGGAAEDDDGGGIFVGQDATLSLANSTVVDNHASDAGDGGGIYVQDGADASISGSIIGTVSSPNTTEEDGGGIYVDNGATLTLTGGSTVTGNTAGDDGGGIYVDQDSEVAETVATITGSTISGNESASDGGGIYVDSDASLSVSALTTISGNAAESDGGGIYVNDDATATITGSTISGNAAESDGGGLSVDGTATLSGTIVTANDADLGGGIYIDSQGTVNVNAGSVVSDNDAFEGGGIANEGSDTLNMNGSTVSGNEAIGDGGGIWNRWDATANIVNSTIDSNTAGADPNDEIDGDGGGIYSGFSTGGALTITGSTISNNDAEDGSGGGIYSRGQTTSLLNSTVSGNTADEDGGGIFIDGSLEAQFSTVASNSAGGEGEGGGIWTQGQATFYATIVANNGAAGDCHHNDTGVDTLGSNLDTDDTCDFDHGDDLPDANAKLDLLASNQPGSTQTHALQFDSPAVDAVEPASQLFVQAEFLLVGLVELPTCPATDQRGITRPQDGDSDGVAVCDIGAYELLPPAVSITDVTVTEGDSGTVDAVFTVTLSRPSTGTVTVAFATANGTATVVTDYQAATGTVTFAPSDVSETITVKVVGDTIDEPNETFIVNLTAPFGATVLDAQGTGTILDDDVAPTPAPIRQETLGGTSLPDTRTGGTGLEGWGAGVAIGLVVVSAAALIRNRRRQTVRTR